MQRTLDRTGPAGAAKVAGDPRGWSFGPRGSSFLVSAAEQASPEDDAPRGRARRLLEQLDRTVFPGGVRLWHFIVLPAAGMGLAIAAFHGVDLLVEDRFGPLTRLYAVARTVSIAGLMASLIAWLALRHRREYETKLQARNRALEATRDFLTRIIEGSGEAIVTLSPDGHVTSWNRAAKEIFGWSAEEMLGQPVESLFPSDPSFAREWRESQELLRSGKTLRDFETTRVRKDGHRITVRVTRSPLTDAGGRFVGSSGIVRDVTAVKEMEARLLERERLAAVGELAARVAHEIKNPLAGMRGACEILAQGYGPGDARQEVSREVLAQVDRLNRTVEDLLLFARPKASKPTPTDLHQILDRTLGVLLEDPRTREIEIVRRYAADAPPLHVDPQQMEQVFINVLVNAFQAMDYRGRILLRTAVEDEKLLVRVRDTGPGFDRDIADRIFEPFFTTRSRGTGLGLSIVRNLVQAHDGAVTAGSPPGGGAQFTIALPLRGAASR